ncbi:unnamed protein product [Larinioides sclopetarius]|uniref:Uncharacterized protein n=1 Tax=Larinioides sclopetarius TaxID=280406 RepID=A0AAV2BTB8_9ARAC
MESDSAARASHCPSISSQKYSMEDDFISELLGFDKNYGSKVNQSSNASRMDIESHHYPLNSSGQCDEMSKYLSEFKFGQTFKELMQAKKDVDMLHEKLKLSEKEKANLQLQFDVLLAENYQIKYLKKQHDEINQKVNELQEDLSDKLKAHRKWKKEAESCCMQLSEKSKTIRKMKKDRKNLWSIFKRFAHKLENAGLLTMKEKNIIKKSEEQNTLDSDDAFESEDGETKDQSFLSDIQMSTEERQNRDYLENESRCPESSSHSPIHIKECDNQISKVKSAILFNQCSSPSSETELSSKANYTMKSCREDPHRLNDSLDVNISELREMRKLFAISHNKFASISPPPSTSHSSSTKYKHDFLMKDLPVDNSVLTLPILKSLDQIPKTSESQGLQSVNSSVPSITKKLAFCHQQSEFDVVPEHSLQRLNLDISNLNHLDLSESSLSNSMQVPYKFSAKRNHDNTVKLNFHINNPISMTVNPNNWEVSCILESHKGRKSDTFVTPQSKLKSTYVKTCESCNSNLMTCEENKSNSITRKMPKVERGSPSGVIVRERPDQSSLVSFKKSNVFKPNITNPDVPANKNSIHYFSEAMAIKKALPFDHPQRSAKSSKEFDAFGNTAPYQYSENLMDDNSSLLSVSCENLSCTKSDELSSHEFPLPFCKSVSTVSEAISKELDNPSNDSVSISVESPAKALDQSISVKMPKDTFLNISSDDHVGNFEIDENLKMITEVLDSVLTCSTCCPIANSEHSVVPSEEGGDWNNSEPVVVSNPCDVSATNFSNNELMEQKIDTIISDASNLFENQRTTEIPSTMRSKISSSVVTDNFLTDKVPPHTSFVQENNISMGISVSILSLPPMSISKSPAKAKYSGFTSAKNSLIISKDFPEQLDKGSLVDINSKPLKKSASFDNKSFKYLVASPVIKSSSILNNKKMNKSTSFQENKEVEKAETNPFKSFDTKEFVNAIFCESLIKDKVQESDLQTDSDIKTKERFSSNIGETIDNNLLDKTVITNVEDLQVSPQAALCNITPSVANSSKQIISDISSLIYMMIDNVVAETQIKEKTQESPLGAYKKRLGTRVNCSHQTNNAKMERNLQSANLSTTKKSSLLNGDTKQINSKISEINSYTKSPIIEKNFKKVQSSIFISEVGSVKENIVHSENNSINKTPPATRQALKKSEDRIELSPIEAAFQEIEKIKFTTTAKLKLHVQNLVTVLSDPSISDSSQNLVFFVVKYLHNTRINFMSNNPDTLLPVPEQCIVKALLAVNEKKFPHLSGLLLSAIETMYYLVLWKTQYHMYGLCSLCRVMAAVCKELKDPSKPRLLCCNLLKYNHEFGPFLIAAIVSVYKEAFQFSSDRADEEKIFLSILSYGVQQKPKALTNIQWKHCKKVFSEVFIFEGVNISKKIPYLKNAIEDKCLGGALCPNLSGSDVQTTLKR